MSTFSPSGSDAPDMPFAYVFGSGGQSKVPESSYFGPEKSEMPSIGSSRVEVQSTPSISDLHASSFSGLEMPDAPSASDALSELEEQEGGVEIEQNNRAHCVQSDGKSTISDSSDSNPWALDTSFDGSSGDGDGDGDEVSESESGSEDEDRSYDRSVESDYGSRSYLSSDLEYASEAQRFTSASPPAQSTYMLPTSLENLLANSASRESKSIATEIHVKQWLHNQPGLNYNAINLAVETLVTPADSEDGDEGYCSFSYDEDEDADSESSSVTVTSDLECGGVAIADAEGQGAESSATNEVSALEVNKVETPALQESCHAAAKRVAESYTEGGRSFDSVENNGSSKEQHPRISTSSRQLNSTLPPKCRP